MLLQTNSYIVPKEKRGAHARLMMRFRHCFRRLGSDFEVYEQTGPGFTGDGGGRFVQIMRFRDRRQQQEVNAHEKEDPVAQRLISEFCDLVNLPYQQQQGLFAAAYYAGVLRPIPGHPEAPPASHGAGQKAEGDAADEVKPALPENGAENEAAEREMPGLDAIASEFEDDSDFDAGGLEPDGPPSRRARG